MVPGFDHSSFSPFITTKILILNLLNHLRQFRVNNFIYIPNELIDFTPFIPALQFA